MEWHERAYDSRVLAPPDPPIVGECEECGYELVRGESCIKVDGATLCWDESCFTAFAKKSLNPIETTA